MRPSRDDGRQFEAAAGQVVRQPSLPPQEELLQVVPPVSAPASGAAAAAAVAERRRHPAAPAAGERRRRGQTAHQGQQGRSSPQGRGGKPRENRWRHISSGVVVPASSITPAMRASNAAKLHARLDRGRRQDADERTVNSIGNSVEGKVSTFTYVTSHTNKTSATSASVWSNKLSSTSTPAAPGRRMFRVRREGACGPSPRPTTATMITIPRRSAGRARKPVHLPQLAHDIWNGIGPPASQRAAPR